MVITNEILAEMVTNKESMKVQINLSLERLKKEIESLELDNEILDMEITLLNEKIGGGT